MTNIVNHSVDGEFAYRNGTWKLVFKIPGKNLAESRGKPAVTELYNLSDDIAEEFNILEEHPEIVSKLTNELKTVVYDVDTMPQGDISADIYTIYSQLLLFSFHK